MKSKLSDWASFAEIASGVAVVVTLIFLIVGIRENTSITRASIYSGLVDSLIEWERAYLHDPVIWRISQGFFDGDITEFDESDRTRLLVFTQNLFRIYEKAFLSSKYEIIGDDEWVRFERNICLNHKRASVVGLDMAMGEIFTQEFSDYIKRTCPP